MCAYFMSAVKEIESIVIRLKAQSLAAELSAKAFTQFFTQLGKNYNRVIAAGGCCLAITEKFIVIISNACFCL